MPLLTSLSSESGKELTMKEKLLIAVGVSSLTLVFLYSILSTLTLTYALTVFMALLSGLTLSLAGALVAVVVKESK